MDPTSFLFFGSIVLIVGGLAILMFSIKKRNLNDAVFAVIALTGGARTFAPDYEMILLGISALAILILLGHKIFIAYKKTKGVWS